MHSCIYEGTVAHRRYQPVDHDFRYRMFMAYLDLDELPRLVGVRGIISNHRRSGCSFLRSDHLFDHSDSLSSEVRRIVAKRTGETTTGPIRLLTQLRYFGYYFSPLNLFFVYDEHEQVEHIVAEVSNTPWNERHCYVLWEGNRCAAGEDLRFRHNKEFHVSPFMGMDMLYDWRVTAPGKNLSVNLSNSQGTQKMFSAGMTLTRHELTRSTLRRMTFRYPFMTAQIGLSIYYQALKLWWKKCPFYTHPKKLAKSASNELLSPQYASEVSTTA